MIEVSIHYPVCREVNEPSSDKVRIEFVLPKRPFMLWADHHIAEMIPLPKGWGLAYHDPIRARDLMVLKPFNIVVGFLIWSYQWTRVGFAVWLFRHSRQEKLKSVGGTNHQKP